MQTATRHEPKRSINGVCDQTRKLHCHAKSGERIREWVDIVNIHGSTGEVYLRGEQLLYKLTMWWMKLRHHIRCYAIGQARGDLTGPGARVVVSRHWAENDTRSTLSILYTNPVMDKVDRIPWLIHSHVLFFFSFFFLISWIYLCFFLYSLSVLFSPFLFFSPLLSFQLLVE